MTPPAARYPLSPLVPSSGGRACLVEHLRQLLALLLGGPLTSDAMLVRPVIRICVPCREHLVVVAGDLGHRNRRCPADAPATLADLIWSFQLTTRFPACVGQHSLCRDPCPAQPDEWIAFRGSEIVRAKRPQTGRSLRFDGRGGPTWQLCATVPRKIRRSPVTARQRASDRHLPSALPTTHSPDDSSEVRHPGPRW